MILSPIVIFCILGIAAVLFVFGLVFYNKKPKESTKPKKQIKGLKDIKELLTKDVTSLDASAVTSKLNDSKAIQHVGSYIKNTTELEQLFRKAKNPWNLTPASFNFIRFGGLIIGIVLGIVFLPFAYILSIIFLIFAVACFFLPKQKYESIAKFREQQWNQLYQFIWVIKHNLSYFDAKKTFFEVENYIANHSENLPELVEGFHDFGTFWTGVDIPEYIQETYGEFDIPSQLFSIVLNAHETGEYPEQELNALRQIIVQRMDFSIKEALAMVETKATLISSPFLLITMMLIVLVPVGMNLLETLG